MVGLLGTRDELLHVIEREFSRPIFTCAATRSPCPGPPRETELVGRLFGELLELQRKGAELSPDAVERTLAMLRGGRRRRPARPPGRRADAGHPVRARPDDPARRR